MSSFYSSIRGQGDLLLMIHGIISDSTFFEKSAVCLEKNYRVITYDRRGYGKNREEEYTDYSVHAQAEDAAGILREIGSEPAWILGNSAGGLIGIELALCHPELVKGMILIEPSLGYDPKEREKLLEWNQELNGYLQAGKIKRALPAFSRVVGGGESGKESVTLAEIRRTYLNLQAFMYGELNEVQHYLPPIGALRNLEIPVFVGVTNEGRESIFATSSKTAADMIGWPVLHFPGYHNVAKENPEAFSALVHETISNIYTGSSLHK